MDWQIAYHDELFNSYRDEFFSEEKLNLHVTHLMTLPPPLFKTLIN